jgi:ubiquinone biosynthesis protein UbiJ
MVHHASWINDLLAIAAASEVLPEVAPIAVSFETPEGSVAIHFANGSVIDSAQAECAMRCQAGVLERLIRGQETLQVLYLSGDVELTGRPEALLKLAFIFEQSARV